MTPYALKTAAPIGKATFEFNDSWFRMALSLFGSLTPARAYLLHVVGCINLTSIPVRLERRERLVSTFSLSALQLGAGVSKSTLTYTRTRGACCSKGVENFKIAIMDTTFE
jgi:hypothetical protein